MEYHIYWKDTAPACSKREPLLQWGHLTSDFRRHQHDFCELVFILSGSALHTIDGEPFQVSPGNVYLLTEGMAHAFSKVDNLKLFNIQFHPKEALYIQQLRDIPAFRALFEIEPRYRVSSGRHAWLTLDPIKLADIQTVLQTMHQEQREKRDGYQLTLTCMFNQLVVKLARYYAEQSSLHDTPPMQLTQAIAYLEENFTANVQIAEAATRAHYSTRHLCRLFQTLYGISPMEYVMQLRLERAKTLLKTTQRSISDIAQSCGFSDSSYFARQFGERYHTTPTKYRNASSSK